MASSFKLGLLLGWLLLGCGLGDAYGQINWWVNYEDYAFTTLAGPTGGPGYVNAVGTNALFNGPTGVAVDSTGNLYVADQLNNVIRKITPDGTVSTLAGGGRGYFADGLGTNASFLSPSSVVVDPGGNVYVADLDNGVIRKITPDGTVTTLAGQPNRPGYGNGNRTNATFSLPIALAMDGAGNLYVLDSQNNAIRKISPNGMVSTVADGGVDPNAAFSRPTGLAVDRAGNLFVADQFKHAIRKVTPDGMVSTLAGSGYFGITNGVGTNAAFCQPSSLAVDAGGNVYVTDGEFYEQYSVLWIRKITPDGTVSTLAGSGWVGAANYFGTRVTFPLNNYYGLAFDGGGNLYVADTGNSLIRKLTPDGTVTIVAGSSGGPGEVDGNYSSARFSSPNSVTMDGAGVVYVADAGNHVIRKMAVDGTVSTVAGNGRRGHADGTGTNATFYSPGGLVADAAGNLWVADSGNNAIRKITPDGKVSTVAGGAGNGYLNATTSNALFSNPQGLALDGLGNLFVADQNNHVIRKITPGGLVSTLAGSGLQGNTNGIGTNAMFSNPAGVAVDRAGNVFVADSGNGLIRQIGQDGTVSTLAGGGIRGTSDGQGTNAGFFQPTGLAFDTVGNLFVADKGDNAIRKITADGTVSTLGGSGYRPGIADGTGAMARFSSPAGLVVDPAGNLIIADAGNNRIRKGIPIPPTFPAQPQIVRAVAGISVTLAAAVGGVHPMTYQWQRSGTNLPGATNMTYTIASVGPGDAGSYSLVASNSLGQTTGTVAVLTLVPLGPLSEDIARVNVFKLGRWAQTNIGPAALWGVSPPFSAEIMVYANPTNNWLRGVTMTTSVGTTTNLQSNAAAALSFLAFDSQTNMDATLPGGNYTFQINSVVNGMRTVSVPLGTGSLPNAPQLLNWTAAQNIDPTQDFTLSWSPFVGGTTNDVILLSVYGPGGRFDGLSQGKMDGTATNYLIPAGSLSAPGAYQVFLKFSKVTDFDTNTYPGVSLQGLLEAQTVTSIATLMPPSITSQPASQITFSGSNVAFNVTVDSSGVPAYQWRKNGARLTDGGVVAGSGTAQLTLTAVGLVDAANYDVVVTNNYGSVTSQVATLSVLVLPANDNFANAIVIPTQSNPVQVTGSNVNATVEPGEPGHNPFSPNSHSVWWAWTPTNSGAVTISIVAGGFNPVVAIYTGNALTNLTQLGCSLYATPMNVAVTAGTTYYLAVDGYYGASGNFSFTIGGVGPGQPPVISYRPQQRQVLVGSAATFGVNGLSGTGPFGYRWLRNGTNLVDGGNVAGAGTATLSLTNAALADAGNYVVVVTNNFGSVTSLVATLSVYAPAPNDDFVNATVISPDQDGVRVNGANVGATVEIGEPQHNLYGGNSHTVWWAWTPTNTGLVTFSVLSPNFRPFLAIYSGSALTNLTQISYSQSYGYTNYGATTMASQAGVTYYLAVDGWGGGTGDFSLTIGANSLGPPPSIYFNYYDQQSLTMLAGQTANFPVPQIYGWPPFGYHWRVNGTNLADGPSVTGSGTPSLTISNTTVADSGNYDLVVTNYFGSTTSAVVTLTVLLPPVNDFFTNATVIPVTNDPVQVSGNNFAATAEPGEPRHDPAWTNSHSLWWSWTPTNSGAVTVTTTSSFGLYPVTAVYTGSSLTNLTQLTYREASSPISLSATAGTTYYIALDGCNGDWGSFTITIASAIGQPPVLNTQPQSQTVTAGQAVTLSIGLPTGSVPFTYHWRLNGTYLTDGAGVAGSGSPSLTVTNVGVAYAGNYDVVVANAFGSITSAVTTVTVVLPPVNDNFANASIIPPDGAGMQVTGSNTYATAELGEPNHFGSYSPNLHSVWWSWTPTNSGMASIGIYSSNFGAGFAVYTGSALTNLSPAGNTSYSADTVNFAVTSGVTYYIAVDGYYSWSPWGDYVLTIGGILPAVTTQPLSQSAGPGGRVSFSVGTTGGAGTNTYQWQFNGTNIAGATGPTLTVNNISAANAGLYRVIVTALAGSVTSADASLLYYGDLRFFAGTVLAGPIGQQFRVDYADVVAPGPTNWQVLTNLFLPSSPFLVVDPDSVGKPNRFYRAVPLP